MSLHRNLESFKAEFAQNAPEDKQQTYEEFISQIGNSGLIDKAFQVGQQAVDFTLSNASGESVNFFQLLQQGPAILTWYRGGWCPYCNLTLRALQSYLPQFKENGASLVALTPEVPDKSLTTREKHNLEFEVLTDLHNQVAKSYGTVFRVPPEVMIYYNQGFNMREYNGDDSAELPLAATYIVDPQGIIQYAYLDADYRKRAEPEDLVKALEQIQS